MRIRKPRGLTTTQLMVTTVVGILGGLYIYKPLLLDNRKKSTLHNANIEPVEATISIEPINRAGSTDQTAVAK